MSSSIKTNPKQCFTKNKVFGFAPFGGADEGKSGADEGKKRGRKASFFVQKKLKKMVDESVPPWGIICTRIYKFLFELRGEDGGAA